jgi:gentisate 1,2-dioxygenase
MPDDLRFRSMADMPAQMPTNPATQAEARARFFNSGNAFMVVAPPVPDHSFSAEPARALNPATPTGLIACDISKELGREDAATAPFLLARYARIRANDTLSCRFAASGVIYYVITGSGQTDCSGEAVHWGTGDVFILPGGVEHAHRAGSADAVLWLVSNEPFLALERMQPPAEGDAPTKVVHYPATEIARQMDVIHAMEGVDAGRAVMFSSDTQEHGRNILPTLTLAMNSLPPGYTQRAHRHNSVAVALVISGEACYSLVDGRRKDWAPYATPVTPPTSVHSHTNEGASRALFLIVQDGGLYHHARAMGFSFDQ